MFKEPIEVQPNTNYTASANLKGFDSHYGTKGMRKVVVECPNGQNVTFQFSYVAGNNNGTSVEDGQIPEVIFYTWREKNMYLNFDVVLFSEKYLWNKYSMYVRSWEKKS